MSLTAVCHSDGLENNYCHCNTVTHIICLQKNVKNQTKQHAAQERFKEVRNILQAPELTEISTQGIF